MVDETLVPELVGETLMVGAPCGPAAERDGGLASNQESRNRHLAGAVVSMRSAATSELLVCAPVRPGDLRLPVPARFSEGDLALERRPALI
jgi:hypothetical protein